MSAAGALGATLPLLQAWCLEIVMEELRKTLPCDSPKRLSRFGEGRLAEGKGLISNLLWQPIIQTQRC